MPNMSNVKVEMPSQEPEIRATNFKEVALGYTKEMAQEEAARCLNCKKPRCVDGCPVNVPIPHFIQEVVNGDFEKAYEIITTENALPAICGRVCPQENQCEGKCIRGIKGESVAIGRLERFVADYHRDHGKPTETKIEKNGKKEYPMRTLSDTLKISGTAISKALDELENEALIKRCEDQMEITERGLEALEPYRVKRAVIMAAGFGSRMVPVTLDRPKPMVAVNGVRIIDTLLDALVSVGIKDITLVRGYKKEKFDEILEKYPFINLIDNDIYDKTNNISSAMAALEHIDQCYLCEADLYISNPAIITKYQYCSNILGSYSLETDDWSFKLDNGHITDYQKGNTYCFNYYGISYWTKEDSARLREDFAQVYNEEPEGNDYFWEFIPLVLRKERYAVEVRPCEKSDIMEIDNFYELVQLDSSYKDYPGQEQ